MEFSSKNLLLKQKEYMEKYLQDNEKIPPEQLEKDYQNYQELLYFKIEKHPFEFFVIFTFFASENLFLYFCTRFMLDGFDIDVAEKGNREYRVIVKWGLFDVERRKNDFCA